MAKRRKKKKSVLRRVLIALTVILSVALFVLLGLVALRLTTLPEVEQKEEPKKEIKKEPVVDEPDEASFSFVGMGDNLIHGALYYWEMESGVGYDFTDIYEYTKPYVQEADFAYINQEVICNGDAYELSSYPVFNAPVEVLDAVADCGYDWLSTSSNHCLDTGAEGLITEMNYLEEKYPNIVYTGTHKSGEARADYIVQDINGIKVGLLGYTYGMNGFEVPEDMPWLVDVISEDLIREDMAKLNEISDVQIVAMHWGTEYQTNVTEEQAHYAQVLNECGAEVIIGTHPHVIQPCEMYHGDKQDTLIYYSLGNFLSAQDTPAGMIGGMASFTLKYNFKTKAVSFEDVKFTPTITYFTPDYTTIKTTTIHEFDEEMETTHGVQGTTKNNTKIYVEEIVGHPEGIEVVVE